MKSELNMTSHAPCPCILKSEDNSCFVLIHVDDILAVGRREFVNKLVKCLRSKYEVSTLVMEKPGDELQFLKRRVVLQHDYIQTCDTNTSQTRWTDVQAPGIEQETPKKENPGTLWHGSVWQYRWIESWVSQKLQDTRWYPFVPCSRLSSLPTCCQAPCYVQHSAHCEEYASILKHLVSFLACHEEGCISLNWNGVEETMEFSTNTTAQSLERSTLTVIVLQIRAHAGQYLVLRCLLVPMGRSCPAIVQMQWTLWAEIADTNFLEKKIRSSKYIMAKT